jgi:lysophospholipase L1-like esterase
MLHDELKTAVSKPARHSGWGLSQLPRGNGPARIVPSLRRIVARLTLFVCTLLFCLVAAEFGLRWWLGPAAVRALASPDAPVAAPRLAGKHPYFFEGDRLKVWNRAFYESRRDMFENWPIALEFFDSDRPTPRYLFTPNLRMTSRHSRFEPAQPGDEVVWSSNSWGLRGKEFSVEKPAGTLRIVCLGASTTEGSQADGETYPVALEKELQSRFAGHAVEVINAGHHGQTVADLVEVWRMKIAPLKPDLIVFYEANNDIRTIEYYDAAPKNLTARLTSGLLRRSVLLSMARQRLHLPPPPVVRIFRAEGDKPSALQYRERLRILAEETRRQGTQLVLVSFVTLAHEGLEVSREDNAQVHEAFRTLLAPLSPGEIEKVYRHVNDQARAVAQEFGLPFLDVAQEFPKDLRYFPFDFMHLSPEGNALLARLIAEGLTREVLEVRDGRLIVRTDTLGD